MQIVILVALAVAACTRADDGIAPRPPTNDGVTLVTVGEAPQRLLRYQLARGAKSRLELAMDMDMEAGGRGGKMPTLAMTLEIAVDDVLPDGNARVRTTIVAAQARERTGAVVPVQLMGQMAQDLTGLTFTGTLTPTGALRDGKLDTKQLPDSLKTQLAKLTQILEQVAMPLPDAPVGVGATWTTRKTAAQDGLQLVTVTTIELTKLAGDQIGFASSSTITAPNQELDQDGVHVSVRDLGGGGSARGTIDLARATLIGSSALEFRGTMTAQGQTAPMKMAMLVTMSAPP
jgi:hypothetical protein